MKKENSFVKSSNDAEIAMCFLPTDFTLNEKTKFEQPTLLKNIVVNSSAYTMDLYDLSANKIYIKPEKEVNDISKIITDLQFNFLDKGLFRFIIGYDHSSSILGERAFYCKCLKENKVPVILHLGSHVNFQSFDKPNVLSNDTAIARALDYGYKPENICLIGPRSASHESMENLKKFPEIDCFKTIDIMKLGVTGMVHYLANKYKDKKYEIYVSFNLDILDSSYVPEAYKPEAFGLSSFEALALLQGLVTELNVQCLDVVGFNPRKDSKSITTNLAKRIVKEVIETVCKTRK